MGGDVINDELGGDVNELGEGTGNEFRTGSSSHVAVFGPYRRV